MKVILSKEGTLKFDNGLIVVSDHDQLERKVEK